MSYNSYQAENDYTNALGLSYNGNLNAGAVLRTIPPQSQFITPQQVAFAQFQQQQTAQQQYQQQQTAQQQYQQQQTAQRQVILVQKFLTPQQVLTPQQAAFAQFQQQQNAQKFVAQAAVPQQFGGQYQAQPRWPGQQPCAIGYVPVTTTSVRYF
jgi:hypothetical protein